MHLSLSVLRVNINPYFSLCHGQSIIESQNHKGLINLLFEYFTLGCVHKR